MTDALATPSAIDEQIARARELLAEANTAEEGLHALTVADGIEAALSVLHKRTEGACAAYASAWELAQKARRRFGELTRDLPQAPRGRPRAVENISPVDGEIKASKTEELKRLGVSSQQASRNEKLAALPDEEFAARLENGRLQIVRKVDGGMTSATSASDHDGDSWGSPEPLIAAARKVLGSIGLDPASNAMAQNVVRADRFYTKAENGLSQPWKTDGGLWLNPPYSKPLVSQFARRWNELAGVDFAAGLLLVNNATDTEWFQELIAADRPVCFTKRIAFLGPDGEPVKGARQGQAIFYQGPKLPLFAKTFRQFGEVMVRYSR